MHFVPPAELCFKPDPGEGWFSFCRREKATRVLKGQEQASRATLVIADVPPPHGSFSPRPVTCREPPAAALCGPSGAGSAAGSTGQPAGAGRGRCPHRGRRAARTAPRTADTSLRGDSMRSSRERRTTFGFGAAKQSQPQQRSRHTAQTWLASCHF